ncbi:MAG: sulfatase [Candidatus Hydrogenedentes bacterium]|nr:sulfatase [Candidatus Hydrogenedentota bacterium]
MDRRIPILALAALNLVWTAAAAPPNVVLIFTDDQGYGDVGCYGAEGYATPNLDALAAEGARFTDFYVPAPVCTPSRGALMTGSYPMRIGLGHRVLFPYSTYGLHPDETTLAEVLRGSGYATGMVGKWHLGHHPPFLPARQGFDHYFGIPYSNDMNGHLYKHLDFLAPPLPLMRGEYVIENDPDQRYLTRRFTEDAVRFIDENRDRPFFLYLAHAMPHVPIYASEAFLGSTEHGLYGDVIAEVDWSVGEIVRALDAAGIAENTLIIFTSDNGQAPGNRRAPQGEYTGGSAGPLRGHKNTTWEGGMRVPCIMRWPARIPPGTVVTELATTMDLLPTVAGVAGAPLPEVTLDGRNILPLMRGDAGAKSPHDAFYYYRDNRLQAVRSGGWKLHVHRPEWAEEGHDGAPLLFNLRDDIGETTDVAAAHPEVVRALQERAEAARAELGDAVTGQVGAGVRPYGLFGSERIGDTAHRMTAR